MASNYEIRDQGVSDSKNEVRKHEYVSLCDKKAAGAILAGLSLVTGGDYEEDTDTSVPPTRDVDKVDLYQVSDRMNCTTCGITFEDRVNQVDHYKSDWHRYNLKQKLRNGKIASQEDFEKMAELDEVSSLSGSDSSSDDEQNTTDPQPTDDNDDPELSELETLLRRQPKVYFRNQSGQLLSVYRAVLCGKKPQLSESQDLALLAKEVPDSMKWAVFMIGGGHFAGAIFDREKVVSHKTFHRYVVRAKRGTVQSVRDNQGNAPKSGGASIRRYNEAALTQEIHDLIQSWSEPLSECSLIFLRAPSHNKTVFFGGKKPPLDKRDLRIRFIPFPTRRPTNSEVIRIHGILSSVTCYGSNCSVSDIVQSPKRKSVSKPAAKVSAKAEPSISKMLTKSEPEEAESSDEEEMELVTVVETLDTMELQEYACTKKPRRRKNKKKSPPPQVPEQSPDIVEEGINAELRNALYTVCKTGATSELLSLLDTDSVTSVELSQVLSSKFGNQGETLLHVASRAGQDTVVSVLLLAGADPTIRGQSGTLPYTVASNKQVRNEFRRYMAKHPDQWDYTIAQIPAPLTDEMEAEKKARDAERRKIAKKAKKEKEKEQKARDAVQRAEEMERKRYLNLSDREKRALAAEKRFSSQILETSGTQPVLSRCWQCGADITGKVPFEYNDYKFCTTPCLRAHRNQHNS